MKKLIVNADDFGLHPAINAGIIKGCRDGFITSTSLMCSGAAFEDAVLQAKATPALGVGIHLTLVGGGKPLLQARQLRTLVDEDGLLPADYTAFAKRWYAGRIKKAEVVSELQAQLERGLSCGLEITHVDSHQHLHVLPGIADIVLDLCSAFGIKKIRMPQEGWFWRGGFDSTAGRLIGREGLSFCSALAKMKARQARFVYPQHFFGMLAGGNLNEFLVGEIIRNLPDGVSEIMTHPGMDAESLEKTFSWQYHWEDELHTMKEMARQYLVQNSGGNTIFCFPEAKKLQTAHLVVGGGKVRHHHGDKAALRTGAHAVVAVLQHQRFSRGGAQRLGRGEEDLRVGL